MGLLKVYVPFTNATTMVQLDVEGVFIETGTEDGIYNVLSDISDDDAGTPGNIAVSPGFREDMFQFIPFPGAGGHNHDVDIAGLGNDLASASINTENISRQESTLIYTGQQQVLINKGVLTGVTTAPTVFSLHTIHYYQATVDLHTDGDWASPNIHTFDAGQWPVVVATPVSTEDRRMTVFVRIVTPPNVFKLEFISNLACTNASINWIAVGLK